MGEIDREIVSCIAMRGERASIYTTESAMTRCRARDITVTINNEDGEDRRCQDRENDAEARKCPSELRLAVESLHER